MNEKLYERLCKLPRKNLVHLLWESLDYMQAYNGRHRTYCIVKCVGGDSCEDDVTGKEAYKIPSLRTMKKMTEDMSL